MVEQCIVIVSPQQRTGKHHGVEGNVVLGHELIVIHLLGILPPSLPLIRVARRDR
jgi:hypothetical protein